MKPYERRFIRGARAAAAALLSFLAGNLAAQEAFGFGDAAEPAGGPAGDTVEVRPSAESAAAAGGAGLGGVKVGGELEYETSAFFSEPDGAQSLSGAATGRLDFTAKGSSVDAAIKLKINEKVLTEYPENLVDEASVRMYLGKLSLEGGLLKVSWGKADSEGPLDVLNPFDYTDLTVTDTRERKIAQPMLRAAYAVGSSAQVEAVFLPGFEADRYAWTGPWTPAYVRELKGTAYAMLYSGLDPTANGGRGNGYYNAYYSSVYSAAYSAAYAVAYSKAWAAAYAAALAGGYTEAQAAAAAEATAATIAAREAKAAAEAACGDSAEAIADQADAAASDKLENLLDYPETRSLDYAQAGLRLTATVGGADLGLQYFWGFLRQPSFSLNPQDLVANDYTAEVSYDRYHQLGLDCAAVVAGFNLRAEAALNLTEDLEGDDPEVHNPTTAWSVGFDRDLFAAVNLNLQYNGNLRLSDGGVGDEAYDIEDGSDALSSKLTAKLSQKLFKDKVEWKVICQYGLEDQDYYLLPSLAFAVGDATIEAGAGFFGGEEDGDLGQFDDCDYGRVTLSYRF